MRPDVRHKSRSLPILRSRIYQKIGLKFKQQKWRQFLNEELLLQWPIRELSKAQFDVNNHSHQKFSVRQNFIMKKEIIKCLEKGELSIALHKLQQLKNKMAMINQQKGAEIMITYLECRKKVLQELKTGEEDRVIDYIKERVSQYIGDGELFMMKLKCLNILCILLLRFHGILMPTQERNIIFKTIQLKKKKFLYLDLQEQRESQFQNLMYLLQQLYKLLFLLKKDQHLILNYYNQLYAYTEIFLESHHNKKSNIDTVQLHKTLKDMKPVISDLNIYEDSKLRRELAVAHIKEEIVQQKQKQFNRRSIDFRHINSSIRTSFNTKMGSSQKLASSSKLRLDSHHSKKLKAQIQGKQKNSGVYTIAEQSTHQLMNELSVKGLKFECLLPIKHKFYILQTIITFRNGFGLIDIEIVIKKQRFNLQIFRFLGMELCVQTLTFAGVYKMMEKMFIRLFGNAQFFELHNLITVELKADMYFEELVPFMVRAKAMMKEYFRKNYYEQALNCTKFVYPSISPSELKNELETEAKETVLKLQKVNFVKRKGMIHRDEDLPSLEDVVYLKGILAKRYAESTEYFVFNAHFRQCFKGLDLLSFKDGVQLQQLPLYIKVLKSISKSGSLTHKTVTKTKSIDQLLKVYTDQYRVVVSTKQFKVEQELQLNPVKLKSQALAFKFFTDGKYKMRKSKKKPSGCIQVILTKEKEYSIFRKEVNMKSTIYKNERTNICIPKGLDQNFKLIKKRIRMYSSIKVVYNTETETKTVRLSFKHSQSKSQEKYVLTFINHFVLKKRKGYFMVLVYKCPNDEYLYEIVDKMQRYYFFTQQQLKRQTLAQLNPEKQKFGDLQISLFTGKRNKISEANAYYIQTKEQNWLPTQHL